MLKTASYHNNLDKNRRLLELVCAFDSGITRTLDDEVLSKVTSEVILKLLILVSIHSRSGAEAFLLDLENSSAENVCRIVESYLEIGENVNIQTSELQQEIVHFSRIVDLEGVSSILKGASRVRQKRLQNSRYIPVEVKILLELASLVIERNVSRGKTVSDMPYHSISSISTHSADGICFSFPERKAEYLLAVSFSRSRVRRDISYLYRNLLAYVGPRAALEIAALQHLLAFGELSGLILEVLAFQDGRWIIYSINGKKLENFYKSAKQLLSSPLPISEAVIIPSSCNTSSNLDEICVQLDEISKVRLFKKEICEVTLCELKVKMIEAVDASIKHKVTTIEAGHLHLDRLPSKDQEIGISLGNVLATRLKTLYEFQPLLTPMYDDDHVTIRTSPEDYVRLFTLGETSRRPVLIPESSPIVKAICVALFIKRIQKIPNHTAYLGGDNLYLKIDNSFTVELFENFNNLCDLGCVFFEIGLLVYRSHIDKFNALFARHFSITSDIHEVTHKIWSKAGKTHDEKAEEIRNYYALFSQVTCPHQPNVEFVDELMEIVDLTNHTHANILEDYYEVQQGKVRRLLDMIGINICLYSIHFNRFTGRVVVN